MNANIVVAALSFVASGNGCIIVAFTFLAFCRSSSLRGRKEQECGT